MIDDYNQNYNNKIIQIGDSRRNRKRKNNLLDHDISLKKIRPNKIWINSN